MSPFGTSQYWPEGQIPEYEQAIPVGEVIGDVVDVLVVVVPPTELPEGI